MRCCHVILHTPSTSIFQRCRQPLLLYKRSLHGSSRLFIEPTIKKATSTCNTQIQREELERIPSWWRRNLPHWLFRESIVADLSFNRWLVPPAAIATHMCIGSVYAWSIFNGPLSRELGVVAASNMDWALADLVPVFSTSIVFLGAILFSYRLYSYRLYS